MSDVRGPYRITCDDIASINNVFSEAFTERYRRDGMVGVRVPTLNPSIWQFSLEDAAEGAMLWRDAMGEIAAFNVAHRSGGEGWMGPLAVRPDLQGRGLGKTIVRAGIDWLRASGACVIGLETMPRTIDNIGFYSSLGFVAGRLTVTFTLESAAAEPVDRLGRYGASERESLIAECAALTKAHQPSYDFTREIELTASLGLGDTVLLRDGSDVVGFAVCHSAPLVEGRAREELRVLKVVLADACHAPKLATVLAAHAREACTQRAAIRVQSDYESVFRDIVKCGGRVRWTDLRMTLAEYPERKPANGVVLSNWEI
ncbi:MAG TPA: GNAT family N-acetyltransferase [Gemmatimonadaceae bacterium]|nr:GNAT family N-acetyltransferase [Gemmatimonadaceae bacterium]